MSDALLASKTIVREEEPRVRSLPSLQQSIVAAVGVTERGPIAEPVLVSSFDEFVEIFGGFTADADLTLFAYSFFEGGGQFMYAVRVVHFSDVTDPLTGTAAKGTLTLQTAAGLATAGTVLGSESEPFALTPGQTLGVDIDGGGSVLATFDAARASVTAGSAPTYALVDAMELTVRIDGGSVQTIEFLAAEFSDIGNATLAEVNAVINAKLNGGFADDDGGNPRINSDTLGTDSRVEVTGGTANAVLGFSTAPVDGTGDVADISAVTAAEVKTVVEADVAGAVVTDESGQVRISSSTTGGASSVQVATGALATTLGLDSALHAGGTGAATNTATVETKTEGSYGERLTLLVEDATNGKADAFNLSILDDGAVVETFANLSADETSADYVEGKVNAAAGSKLIAWTDLEASVANRRPANGTFGPFTGGDDGLTGLADTDFIGSESGEMGIRALDSVSDASILAVPNKGTSAIHNAMLTYCEFTRSKSMFAILDCPAALDYRQIVTYVESTAQIEGASEFGGIFWPRPKMLNPSAAVFGDVEEIVTMPSGMVAATFARNDAREGGIYKAAAGESGALVGCNGFETEDSNTERKRDYVAPHRVNIMHADGARPYIDGAETLRGDSNFPYIPQRRGAIFIEQTIKSGIDPDRWKNNEPSLRRSQERSTRAFLKIEMGKGAFASKDPNTAFFVDFSAKLNTALLVNEGQLNGKVGLAFNTPAKWIILTFSRDQRALEAEAAA